MCPKSASKVILPGWVLVFFTFLYLMLLRCAPTLPCISCSLETKSRLNGKSTYHEVSTQKQIDSILKKENPISYQLHETTWEIWEKRKNGTTSYHGEVFSKMNRDAILSSIKIIGNKDSVVVRRRRVY